MMSGGVLEQEFAFPIAAGQERPERVYSVEKLGSCELEIFPMNQIAAENQP